MASHSRRHGPSAPPMYPDVEDQFHPIAPPRSDIAQQEAFLPPRAPPREDIPRSGNAPVRKDNQEEIVDDANVDSTYNYSDYSKKKTIAVGLLVLAMLGSNAMQLRMLILQKQHDRIWIVTLILVCLSILFQLGLTFIVSQMLKGDIRYPSKQSRLERFNNFGLVLVVFVALMNVAINVLMMTTNPKSFLDTRSLERLDEAQPPN